MEQHLTLREARDLTGKGESTIKRMIHKVAQDAKSPDRSLILPSSEEVERLQQSRQPYAWRINRSLLLRWFPPGDFASKGNGSFGTPTGQSVDLVITVLREQLQSKDEQIRTLETQLDRKDEQIAAQNDRLQESNILMRELQQQLAIAPPKNVVSELVVESAPVPPASPTKETVPLKKKNTKKPKRGMFAGLFRRSK